MIALAGKRVLVWGFGHHGGGLAAARFCNARAAQVSILEQKTPAQLGANGAEAIKHGWPWFIGDATHASFAKADLIVASPAIPPRAWPAIHPPVVSPEALFFSEHKGPRIAVTGTKGKSTTAHITGALLGWTVGGNSNEPLLDILARLGPEVPIVCELSSFQLHYLAQQRPAFSVTLLTSLARDHLDWHPDEAHYRATKLAMMPWGEVQVVAPGIPGVRNVTTMALRLVRYHDGVFVGPKNERFATRGDLSLLGDHNAQNACLALTAALHLGLSPSQAAARLRSVRGLPHRLELVHAARGVRFVNDSIATTPESSMAGLAALAGPLAVILGGSNKGADYSALAEAVAARGAMPIVIGQTAKPIAAALANWGVNAGTATTLAEAVSQAVALLGRGGTVLLSPGCASFDMFNGFEDRGRQFTELARQFGSLQASG
jgi:UDP-N-acetylmuramoylalanine--D-glutamate ligase